jgi:hypothetical protein
MSGVFPINFYGQMSQHWYYSQYPNPIVVPSLTPCLTIDAGHRPGEHMAHGFWLFAPHDQKQKLVL